MPLWRRTFGTALTLSRPSQRHRHPVQTVSGRKYPRTAARRPVSAMGQIAETPTARHDRLTGRRSPRMAERAAALASALAARLLSHQPIQPGAGLSFVDVDHEDRCGNSR
jgi:hypothetical protein